jgi:hypothetical protein
VPTVLISGAMTNNESGTMSETSINQFVAMAVAEIPRSPELY